MTNVVMTSVMFFTALFLAILIWDQRRTSPELVVRRLHHSSEPVELRVSSMRGTWNPAESEIGSRIRFRGRAVYRLDDSGIVNLHVQPKFGTESNWAGPIPEECKTQSPYRRARRRQNMLFVMCIVLGFAVGFFVANPPLRNRGGVGLVGATGGMVVGTLSTIIWIVGKSFLTERRGGSAVATVCVQLPTEFLRLRPAEQKRALPAYQRLIKKFEADRPEMIEDNQMRALQTSYAVAAGYWLGCAALFGVPAAILGSFFGVLFPPVLVLLIVAGAFVCVYGFRMVQCFKFFPHLRPYRTRTTRRHPDMYD